VFSADDASHHLRSVRDDVPHRAPPTFTIVLAPEVPPTKVNPDTGIPHLQMAQFRTPISALYELGEGQTIPAGALDDDSVLTTAINMISDGDVRPSTKLTRDPLKHLASWSEWYGAEKEQLDQMHSAKMFGSPQT
jgi:hypothetical protein